MGRFFRSLLVMSSIFALSAATRADDHSHQGHSSNQSNHPSQFHFGNWGGISDIVSSYHHHHGHKPEPTKNPTPIDPGRGDGRVPTGPVPVTQPPARDGFVWIKDHWERAKAPKSVNPYP